MNDEVPERLAKDVKSLPQEEETLIKTFPAMLGEHPFFYILEWALMIIGFGGGLVALVMGLFSLFVMGMIVGVVTGLFYGWWYLNNKFRVLEVTEKRTLFTQGILSKKTNEVQHDDVRNIQMNQSFFQRILSVGDLAISSSGQDDMEISIKGLSDPQKIVDVIRRYQ